MNYTAAISEIRARRDQDVTRARAEARRQLGELLAARDREIRRLAVERPELGCMSIASVVGCSKSTVYEVLAPEKHEEYRQRRRERWRRRAADRIAA